MKKNVCRIIAMVITAVLVLTVSACTFNINVAYDKDTLSSLESIVAKNQSAAPAPAPSQPAVPVVQTPTTTAPAAPVDPAPGDTDNTTAPPAPEAPGSSLPSTNEEILAKYTEVINQMKLTDKPAFEKVEYQVLPEEHRNLGGIANAILKIASGYMTSEEDAKADPQKAEPGSDMGRVPVNNKTGCALTDVSAIKSAECKDNGDGTYTITITLNSEMNPEPFKQEDAAPTSKVGSMFTPLSRVDIDNELNANAAVKALATINSYDLEYYDCTATLVYNSANNHVVTLTQVMNTKITADIKAAFIPIKGSAVLINTMEIYNVVY